MRGSSVRTIGAAVLRLLSAALLLGFSAQSLLASEPRAACFDAALRLEREHRIPQGLLYALALAESGRWDAETASSHAWPWTIRAGPDAYVAESLNAAVGTVERLRRNGRRNIDIGCMQVNLMYHPKAFSTIAAGFDPDANIRYAAGFLKRLRERHHSWAKAIERYHSSDRERALAYRKRVYEHWNAVRRELADARMAGRQPPRLIRPTGDRDGGSRERGGGGSGLHLIDGRMLGDGPVLLK